MTLSNTIPVGLTTPVPKDTLTDAKLLALTKRLGSMTFNMRSSVKTEFFRVRRDTCAAAEAKAILRLDPWKAGKDLNGGDAPAFIARDWSRRTIDRLDWIAVWCHNLGMEMAIKGIPIAAVLVNHEEWIVTPENEHDIRLKLECVHRILQCAVPGVPTLWYNNGRLWTRLGKPFPYIPSKCNLGPRGCSMYHWDHDRNCQSWVATADHYMGDVARYGNGPTAICFSPTGWWVPMTGGRQWLNAPRGNGLKTRALIHGQYINQHIANIPGVFFYVPAIDMRTLGPALEAFGEGVGT